MSINVIKYFIKKGATMELSKNLKRLRENAEITQIELAEKINVSQSAIALFEAGTKIPSVAIVIRIADVFECTVDELLGRRVS